MTLTELDREIRDEHGDADIGWKRLLDAETITREQYVRQLAVTYGFEAPYEAACAYTPGLAQVIDLRGRWRSGLIAQDLLALGWGPAQITNVKCCSLSPFSDAAEALGWMFVVERSTLLYHQLREQLTDRFVDLARACMYLSAYDNSANRRWGELGVALDHLCASGNVSDRIIAAARNAVGVQRDWRRANAQGLRSVG